MDMDFEERRRLAQADSLFGVVGHQLTRKCSGVALVERFDRKLLVKVSLVYMVISVGIILAAVILYIRNTHRSQSSNGDPSFVPGLIEGWADDTMETLKPDMAVEIVRAALGNRDPMLVADFFSFGCSAGDTQEVITLLEDLHTNEGSPDGLESLGGKLASGRLAEEVMVTSEKDGRMSKRLVQLFLKDGKWRIDLDSYTRHTIPGWEDILGQRCDVATVRVFVTADSYYNGDRYVEKSWKCYALISPDVDEILFGYAARGSIQEKAMERIISKEEEVHRAALKILIPKTQGRMQFEISQVLADDWFIGESLFEESH